jgi:hypothetical protein
VFCHTKCGHFDENKSVRISAYNFCKKNYFTFSEENFRFYCYADKEENPKNDDVFIRRVSSKFAEFYAINSDQLDKEHSNAWASITGNFHLSHSKAPNSMNQADILQVRNLLLSSLRTPFFDSNSNELAKVIFV